MEFFGAGFCFHLNHSMEAFVYSIGASSAYISFRNSKATKEDLNSLETGVVDAV